MDAAERIWGGVRIGLDNECWPWTREVNKTSGYGYTSIAGRCITAHRAIYIFTHGSESVEGLDVDHLCRNRSCCNPAHLEAVTHAENCRRGTAGEKAIIRNKERGAAVTHCPRGHPYDEANTYVMANKLTGWVMRHCRLCDRDRKRARRVQDEISKLS